MLKWKGLLASSFSSVLCPYPGLPTCISPSTTLWRPAPPVTTFCNGVSKPSANASLLQGAGSKVAFALLWSLVPCSIGSLGKEEEVVGTVWLVAARENCSGFTRMCE